MHAFRVIIYSIHFIDYQKVQIETNVTLLKIDFNITNDTNSATCNQFQNQLNCNQINDFSTCSLNNLFLLNYVSQMVSAILRPHPF